jgi:hypothetical protein
VGSLPAGSPSSLTYTINNTGSGTLLLLSGSFGGQTNCTVTATTQASPTVAAGGSTTLVLSCTPTTGGSAFSFTVSLSNTDADENPYDWTVSGTATAAVSPEMDVDRGGTPVTDGGTDSVGSMLAGSPSSLTYTISNTGQGTLNLANAVIGGQTNCTASVVTQPPATIAASGTGTLDISYTPTTGGSPFSFTVSIGNDDADENPYDWTVSGTATTTPTPNFAALVPTVVNAPVTVAPGGTFDVTREIQNNGSGAGSTSYTIVISDDSTITAADTVVYSGTTASIAAGTTDTATVTCTVPTTTTDGPYYAGLYIDASTNASTVNADVTVATPAPPPPPPEDDGGSCSPIPGGSGPVNVLGLLATYLFGFGLLLWARRRTRRS